MILLAATLALTPAALAVQAAPAQDSDVVFPATRLTVDASAVADGGSEDPAVWESIITKALTEEFRVYHIPVITLDEQATCEVTVSWAGGPESTDVDIHVMIQKAGGEEETRSFVCEDCEFANGAAERIVQELPTLVPLLELPASAEPAVAPDPPKTEETKPRVLAGQTRLIPSRREDLQQERLAPAGLKSSVLDADLRALHVA